MADTERQRGGTRARERVWRGRRGAEAIARKVIVKHSETKRKQKQYKGNCEVKCGERQKKRRTRGVRRRTAIANISK